MEELTYIKINEDILNTLTPPKRNYYYILAVLLLGVAGLFSIWSYQILTGMGVAGINHPIGWGVYITNFVFWVGIAHSGTLISAILFLLRAKWRNAIARSAEAMTVIAVATAGLYPLIHLGRVWKVYWMLPYPNQRFLWPNFRSPLIWDVIAISTYLSVSAMFFYIGLLPDIAAYRDRSSGTRKKIYGILSLGWQNQNRQWKNYTKAYLFFAAFATPLVVSVHSVVSWDFAMSLVPGWHSTIFAPYFVAGAIHSGLAMVITLLIPLRKILKVEHIITMDHFDKIAKVIIFTGLIVGYAYGIEYFMSWYSGNNFERAIFHWRATGEYAYGFWIMVIFNSIVPLAFFFKKVRSNLKLLFFISILINIGMWFERFVIIVSSLAHEFLPFAWGYYKPTWVEFGITIGSFCWFFFLFLIFVKVFPSISVTEIKEILPVPKKLGK